MDCPGWRSAEIIEALQQVPLLDAGLESDEREVGEAAWEPGPDFLFARADARREARLVLLAEAMADTQG